MTQHDVLMVLGYTSWSGAARRSWIHSEDRLTRFLLDSPRVRRLLVCNPYRSLPAKLVRGALGRTDAPFPASPTRSLCEPLRLRRRDPVKDAAVARAVAAYERRIRRTAARAGLERPTAIVAHPLVAGYGDFGWAESATYFATDDHAAHDVLRRWWPAYESSFTRIRNADRAVAAVTPGALGGVGARGAVIPNGIEPSEWLDEPGPPPAWFAALPAPRLLYVGTLDFRLDPAHLKALVEAYPEASIVFVGRTADGTVPEAVGGYPNVTIHPPVERAELGALVAAADVGLIPHIRSELTQAMSPLKLYEYLAAGLPVVATELDGIAGVCPERTALVTGPEELRGAVSEALRTGRWDEASRRRFIADHSWNSRFEDLLDLAVGKGPNGSANGSPPLVRRSPLSHV